MSGRRVEIDLDTCILAGECVYNHPSMFAWSDDDQPMVIHPVLDGADAERAASQAMGVCPSGAIRVVDATG